MGQFAGYPIWLINLDSNPERYESAKKQLHKLGLDAERFSAIYGKNLSQVEVADCYDPALNQKKFRRPLSPGEIGCYLSHRTLWQRMVDENIAMAFILEDDIDLEPEFLAVLEKIKAQGLTTAILSNGSMDMLTSAVKSAGMQNVLDHVISVDPIRLFKTSPESYGLVQKTIPVEKDEVLFVSSNAWDALGATWFGFQTHWVNRQGLPFEALTPQPTFTGSDLNSVLVSLAQLN